VHDHVLPAGALFDMSERVTQVLKGQLGEASESPVGVSVPSQPALRRTREERALHRDMIREPSAGLPPEVRGEVCLSSESSPACHVSDMPDVSDVTSVSENGVVPDSGKVCVTVNTIDPLCQLLDALHLSSEEVPPSAEASQQASSVSDDVPEVSPPEVSSCVEPCQSANLAKAESESTAEINKIRRVRTKVKNTHAY
jgi:hypothetical protein